MEMVAGLLKATTQTLAAHSHGWEAPWTTNAGVGEKVADRVHRLVEQPVEPMPLLDRHGGDVHVDAAADRTMRDAREDAT